MFVKQGGAVCGRIMDYQPSPDLERDHSCLEFDVKVASESVPRARIPGLLSSSFCRLKTQHNLYLNPLDLGS